MLDTPQLAAFVCLFGSLLAALSNAPRRIVAIAFLVTLTAALIAHIVAPTGVAFASAGLLLACLSRHPNTHALATHWRALSIVLLALLALALGFHAIPGFEKQIVMTGFGRDASRTLAWQFDKGLGGLLLLMICSNAPRTDDYRRLLAVLLICPAVLIAFALLGGIATLDPRWLRGMTMWLLGNLFLTVIAEEAFFRGLLQQHLVRWLETRVSHGAYLGIVLVAILFGAVHAPWGAVFALGAGVAGLMYGCLYWRGGLRWAVAGHLLGNGALLLVTRSPLG